MDAIAFNSASNFGGGYSVLEEGCGTRFQLPIRSNWIFTVDIHQRKGTICIMGRDCTSVFAASRPTLPNQGMPNSLVASACLEQ